MMASVITPSSYFETMRTLGNYITVCSRNGSYYVRTKSKTFKMPLFAAPVLSHAIWAALGEYHEMTDSQRAAWAGVAYNYYTTAFQLLLQIYFKAFFNAWAGACWAGAATCGGQITP
jgi:hypothetical protein